jgi:hypothetical protein
VALGRQRWGAVSWPAPVLPLHELPPTDSTRGGAWGREQFARDIVSWRVATHEARSTMGPAARREGGQASAQPGQRAVLGGLGAPPGFSEALSVCCGTHRAGMVLQPRPHRSGRVVGAADGPQPPHVAASLLPLAVRAGALAFAGLARLARAAPPNGCARRSSRFSVRTVRMRRGSLLSRGKRAKTRRLLVTLPTLRAAGRLTGWGVAHGGEDRGRPGDSLSPQFWEGPT